MNIHYTILVRRNINGSKYITPLRLKKTPAVTSFLLLFLQQRLFVFTGDQLLKVPQVTVLQRVFMFHG